MIQDALASLASSAFAAASSVIGNFWASILLLSAGIAIYAGIVGTFYNYLSRPVLYVPKSGEGKGLLYRFGNTAAFLLKYTLLFPAITFLWFAMLAIALFMISGNAKIESVFVISISIVMAVRILSYYRQEIAADLAKMLPLALLGVLLVDHALFTEEVIRSRILELAFALPQFAPFIALAVALEWALRMLHSLVSLLRKKGPIQPAKKP